MATTFRWSDELYHHGTLGQKLGLRRYQNPDGSLTALGRIHYGVGKAKKFDSPDDYIFVKSGKHGDAVQRSLAKDAYKNTKKFEKSMKKSSYTA